MIFTDDEDHPYIDFGYGEFDNDQHDMDKKPRILLMGLHRSGKSSIQKVVFHKMSPSDTLFLESTNKIVKDDINSNRWVVKERVMELILIPPFFQPDPVPNLGLPWPNKLL